MDSETIISTDYAEIMQKSYIDYAMSVIISRALPDVRDGLKPVQRRTLYDMYELGIRYDRPYRKCARIVGDTMGKYHPHGDTSIYEALVVMAQDFKKGQKLVDGHGNFGSIEGDGAAAMRYTEARLEKITQEVFLSDLDKNIVDFLPNFDEMEREPEVLPVRIPNLLLNGAEGIAVGMATNTPPHNLREIVDAIKAYMKNQDISNQGLLRYLKGPDFPTGGVVVNQDDLKEIYETGVGKIKIRGRVELEKGKNGKQSLVITEIPYTMIGANIGKFLNEVAALVENRVLSDVVDISNQSSKEGIRIVLELRRGADARQIENLLYKKTRLEDTFGVNMLAVAEGRPETLSLKKIIEYHVDFQFELTTRKYQTLLAKEQEKKEVQEGLIKACDVIDLIIEILRGSRNRDQVRSCLVNGETEGIRFKSKTSQKQAQQLRFTQRQADAILEMRLYRLIGLEVEALMAEHAETVKNITFYEDVLNNYDTMAGIIIEDLDAIKKEYGRKRRTTIENAEEIVIREEEPQVMELTFLMDRFGYAKTMDRSVYERNKETADRENKYVFPCLSTDRICLFTDTGRMHLLKVSDLPVKKLRDKGIPVDNISNYDSGQESILLAAVQEQVKSAHLLFATRKGMVKQVDGAEYDVSKREIAATKLLEQDRVIFVGIADYAEFIVLQSDKGYLLRFLTQDVPTKKKSAIGVRGMRLSEGDFLTNAYLLKSRSEFTITYKGKQVSLNRLKLSGRDTRGTRQRG